MNKRWLTPETPLSRDALSLVVYTLCSLRRIHDCIACVICSCTRRHSVSPHPAETRPRPAPPRGPRRARARGLARLPLSRARLEAAKPKVYYCHDCGVPEGRATQGTGMAEARAHTGLHRPDGASAGACRGGAPVRATEKRATYQEAQSGAARPFGLSESTETHTHRRERVGGGGRPHKPQVGRRAQPGWKLTSTCARAA